MGGLLPIALGGALLAAPAPEGDAAQQAALREKYEARLREPWVAEGGWIADLDRAKEQAAAEGKAILVYFTVSYMTSDPCRETEGRLLASKEFREMAKEHVRFVHVASRLDGQKRPDLLKEVGGWAVPWFAALGPGGDVVAVMDTKSLKVESVGRMMAAAKEYLLLAGKKEPTAVERVRLLELSLSSGRIDAAAALKGVAALGKLEGEAAAAREALLVRIEVDAELARYKKAMMARPDPKELVETGRVFAEMREAGRVPKDPKQRLSFLSPILEYAESRKDVALFERVLKEIEPLLAGDRNGPVFLKSAGERLERLRAAAGGK